MDAVDEALMQSLSRDGRASFSDLADSLGLTRNVVSARVGELLGSGEVRVVAAVHPHLLGLRTLAHLAVRVAGPLPPIRDALTGSDAVAFLSETTGPFHIAAEVRVADAATLAEILAHVRGIPGVLEVAVLTYERVIRSLFLRESAPGADVTLDATDLELMSILQRDGRLGFGPLGKRVGLSPSAARVRVLRLLEANVMQIGAIRRRAQDSGPDILCGIGVLECGAGSQAVDTLLDQPGLEFLARTLGRYSLVATVRAPSIAGVAQLAAALRDDPAVGPVDTWLHSAVHVERYDRVLDTAIAETAGHVS